MLMATPPLPPPTSLCPPLPAPSTTSIHMLLDLTSWQPQRTATNAPTPVKPEEGGQVNVVSPDLTYLGEGADHIVVRLATSGQVLRLRKTPVGVVTSREGLILRAARDETFLLRVARPILGPLLTDPSRLVEVDPRDIATLRDTVEPWRQGHRQDKEINKYGVACICPDASTIFITRHDKSSLPSPPSPPHIPSSHIPTSVPPLATHSSSAPVPNQPSNMILVVTAATIESQAAKSILNFTENCDLVQNNWVVAKDRDTRTILEVSRGVEVLEREAYPRDSRRVCVEIKPKQGFLDYSTPSLPLCRYCIKQFHKRGKEGLARSSYCPLDLFSGDLQRMRVAVDSMIQSPQNNFKVFEDGQPQEDCRPYRYLRDIIIAALTFDFTSGLAQITKAGKLSSRSALGRIFTFQNLDQLGVFRAARLYEKLVRKAGSLQAGDDLLHDLSLWPASATSNNLRHNIYNMNNQSDSQSQTINMTDSNSLNENRGSLFTSSGNEKPTEKVVDGTSEDEEDIDEIVRELQRYLVSTSAKDLSLMILLSGPFTRPVPKSLEPNTSPFIIQVASGLWFKCQVTGVDLVAKPASKILKHERDYKKLRATLMDLRSSGEVPACCCGC